MKKNLFVKNHDVLISDLFMKVKFWKKSENLKPKNVQTTPLICKIIEGSIIVYEIKYNRRVWCSQSLQLITSNWLELI